MNSKLCVVLVVLALGSLLLPAVVSAQEEGGLPVAVVFTSPNPILPVISGPIILVSGVVEVQIIGPKIEFTRDGSPTILPPSPITPPSPVDE